jgi:hypothetical protein
MKQSNLPSVEAVTEAFKRFREFLNDSWPSVNKVMAEHDWDNDPYFLEDWLDDNWKHLFVRQILGKEADLQPLTISINEVKKHHHQYQLQLDSPPKGIVITLGNSENGFSIAPPFDQVQILDVDGEVKLVPFSTVKVKIVN